MHQAKLWDYLFQGTAAPEVSRTAPKPHGHTQLQGVRTPSAAAWVRKAKAQVSRFIQNLEERQQQDLSNPPQGSNQDWVRSWYIIHEKRTKSLERTEQWTQHRMTLLSMENPVAEHPDSTGEERTWSCGDGFAVFTWRNGQGLLWTSWYKAQTAFQLLCYLAWLLLCNKPETGVMHDQYMPMRQGNGEKFMAQVLSCWNKTV